MEEAASPASRRYSRLWGRDRPSHARHNRCYARNEKQDHRERTKRTDDRRERHQGGPPTDFIGKPVIEQRAERSADSGHAQDRARLAKRQAPILDNNASTKPIKKKSKNQACPPALRHRQSATDLSSTSFDFPKDRAKLRPVPVTADFPPIEVSAFDRRVAAALITSAEPAQPIAESGRKSRSG